MKLQSALEYMTTYGWAILIISIVVVALVVLINLASAPQQTCVLPAGFGCQSYYMVSSPTSGPSDNVVVNLVQSTSYPIQVTAMGCSNPLTPVDTYVFSKPVPIPIGSNYTFNIQCYTNGSFYTGAIGQTFSGYLIVNYTNAYTGFPGSIYGKISVLVSK